MATYNLFISHSWAYSDAYEKLVKLLDGANRFDYRNYSVPKDDPIHNAPNAEKLKLAIKNQMDYASVVLVLAGVYVHTFPRMILRPKKAQPFQRVPVIARATADSDL